MRIVTLDFETYWSSKDYTLSKMGPIQYIRDPRFEAQLLGYAIDGNPVQVVEHDSILSTLKELKLHDPQTITIAHNGDGFDFLILSERYGVSPALTLDTIPLMRWCGLSSVISESHAALTAALGTGVKYAGTVISDGKHWPNDFTEVEREAFRLYCAQDVEQCRANAMKMIAWGAVQNPDVLTFCSITSRMATRPKLFADAEKLSAYREELKRQQEAARTEVEHLFRFRDREHMLSCLRSADKFCAMLRQLGVEPPMKYSEAKSQTKKAQMEAAGMDTSDESSWAVYVPALSKQDVDFLALQDHPDPRVALLCRTRLENNSSIQESRVNTFHRMAMYYKAIPVMLKTFGAHTSRYAAGNTEGKSDALNWQNLSKRNPNMLALRQAIYPMGTLVSCDSSQIEARVLAYVAQQTDVLNLFANHEDVYADFGSTISGIPAKEIHDGAKSGNKELKHLRNVSKTIILGCGYGTSSNKAAHTMWVQGTILGETYEQHAAKVAEYVTAYRAKNADIVRFWKQCTNVIGYMATGNEGWFGGADGRLLRYYTHQLPSGLCVPCIELPSGFCLNYPGLRRTADGKGMVFDKKLGRNTVEARIYGSALTENIVQSLAFQLLMWQACRMTERGIWPCVNIHDSFSVAVKDEKAEQVGSIMLECMKMLPPWLPGCPIDAEVEYAKDFTHA